VEFHVLLSLCRGERHGYGIMLDAEERTGGALWRRPKRTGSTRCCAPPARAA
jgi:hypothetical protein